MVIKGTNIEIPDSLIVDGSLDLSETGVTELPDGLTVGGDLSLYCTRVKKLPKWLYVGGCLDLSGSDVIVIDECLTVGGIIHCNYTLAVSDVIQLDLVKQNKSNIALFQEPTADAIRLHDMLWVVGK